MGTTRHFHVVFDVRILDLNLSNYTDGDADGDATHIFEVYLPNFRNISICRYDAFCTFPNTIEFYFRYLVTFGYHCSESTKRSLTLMVKINIIVLFCIENVLIISLPRLWRSFRSYRDCLYGSEPAWVPELARFPEMNFTTRLHETFGSG
jgi:hypothetical protein